MTPTKNSINDNDIFFIVMIDMYSKCHSMYFKWTYFCNHHSLIVNVRHNELFLPLSFMKMSISCLYWSSELGSLLSIVHVYLLSILKVTFSKSHKLWFIIKET